MSINPSSPYSIEIAKARSTQDEPTSVNNHLQRRSDSKIHSYVKNALEVVAETLWPTRCAICDIPGDLICDDCINKLRFIDTCFSCPTCGSPYGTIQCTECGNPTLELDFPFDGMASALCLDENSKSIISTYKDKDERRLSKFIAFVIANYIKPEWVRKPCVLTYIPDTIQAYRRRSFDHSLEIAQCLSDVTDLQLACLFERPKSKDQRSLGRKERIDNMLHIMHIKEGATIPKRIIIVDDICTTGATLCAAALALRNAGAEEIYGLTFGKAID